MDANKAKKLLDLVIRMGAMLIRSGAETYRVEDTLAYVLKAYGAKEPSVYMVDTLLLVSFKAATVTAPLAAVSGVNSTAISAADASAISAANSATTLKSANEVASPEPEELALETLTAAWRVRDKSINLERLRRLSNLSYQVVRNDLSLAAFEAELTKIADLPTYTPTQLLISGMAVAFGFGLMFQADWLQAALIALIACPVFFLYRVLRVHINEFVINAVCAACAAFLVIAAIKTGYLDNFGKSVAAVLMALMPGALFTNGLRDLIMGDLNAGTNKLIQALMVGVSLALGTAVVLLTWGLTTLQ